MGLLSIAVILASCSKDESNSVDTSKAIRDGNFLQAADFKDVSKLNIHHSDKYVTEKIENGEAEFKYSQPETRSTNSDYKEQSTNISLVEDQLVEFSQGEYSIEFSYCFVLEDPSKLHEAIQNINMELKMDFINLGSGDDQYAPIKLQLGSGGDVPMNDKWSTYRTTFKVLEPGYRKINFTTTNRSKQNDNTFHIRNIQLVKK